MGAFILTMMISISIHSQSSSQPHSPKITCHQAQISPDPLQQGQNGSLSYTISNDGTAPYVGFLLCEWVNLKTGRVDDLPQSTFNGVLYPGQSRTLTHYSNPIISPAGSYQMRVVDGNRKVFDHCTSQEFKVITTKSLSDLKVQTLELPKKVHPGDKLNINVKVINQGTSKSTTCKGRLYWNLDPIFGETAHPIGPAETWPEIPPLSSSSLSLNKTLPSNLPNGPIYFFYFIDWDREVSERDELNNSLSLLRMAAYQLEIIQSVGYVPYPNTSYGGSVALDLYLKNPSRITFEGTLSISLFNPQDSFLIDLASWPNLRIAPTQQSTFTTGIKTFGPLNFPIANKYKIYARYKSNLSNTFSTISTSDRCHCLNPFQINIVAPGAPLIFNKIPSKAPRGQMMMSL